MESLNIIDGMETIENPVTPATTEPVEAARSTANIEISNVSKSRTEGEKWDNLSLDVVLVRYETERSSKATVYYQDSKTSKTVDAPCANIGDVLSDGGLVVNVSKGQVKRKYATLHITLDDLSERIAALPESVWQSRTKTRRPKED